MNRKGNTAIECTLPWTHLEPANTPKVALTIFPPVSGPTPSMPSNSEAATAVEVLIELVAGANALALAARARKATAVFMVKQRN